MDKLKGRKCMVWSFMGTARMYQALRDYGDRLDTVGIFTFSVDATGTLSETGTAVSSIVPYVSKWPHIKWMLTIMNDGVASIFTALRENTNGAQDKLMSEIVRIMAKYPWCAGIDIDLEKGGEYANREKANALFANIYRTVKAYDSTKLVNICLPGMTGVQRSVGGENWCVYADLDAYCDTASIMSYGMAWSGSAPGPVSPRDWLEGIYDYAVTAIKPEKLFLGLPAYGWNWQIYTDPATLGKAYRGTSNTYYAAQTWMKGGYNFTGDAPPQPFIPILAYWDDYDKVPFAFPQVYDFMEGADAVEREAPIVGDVYDRRRFLTSYSKMQKVDFGDILIDRSAGSPDATSGIVTNYGDYISLGENGNAVYNFTVDAAGTYDIAVRICYPFWEKRSINIALDGAVTAFSENRLWWPYWRLACWLPLAKGVNLSAGRHSITVTTGDNGVHFYGFRVCTAFSQEPNAGSARFTVRPRHFIDVDGKQCQPDKGFRLTTEVLRRVPDSALIWYEDFRDNAYLPDNYWLTLSGKWDVWQDGASSASRPYSQLDGYGEVAWHYEGFQDIHIRARLAFPSDGGGRAGVFCGSLFLCLNYETQCLELYNGSTKVGSYSTSFSKTADADLRGNATRYTLEMRSRGNRVRVYSSDSYTLRFTAAVSGFTGGYAGFRSDKRAVCDLLRVGDAWTYEPYERFDVTFPDGRVVEYGRVERSNVVWDEEFQVFTLTTDVEEINTRSESISADYDFYHSDILALSCGNDYDITVTPKDINIWLSRLFLGDADGFSILYYQDVDSLTYWANQAAYRWKLRGIAIWSLGQEDLRLWEAWPKQV